jgi:hypothetical protein
VSRLVKNFKKSRTLQASTLIALLGVLQMNSDFIKTLMSPEAYGWVAIATAMVMVLLRLQTTEPLNPPEEPK